MTTKAPMTNVEAIKAFFNTDGYPPVTTSELRALGGAGLREVGKMCADALGVQIRPPKS